MAQFVSSCRSQPLASSSHPDMHTSKKKGNEKGTGQPMTARAVQSCFTVHPRLSPYPSLLICRTQWFQRRVSKARPFDLVSRKPVMFRRFVETAPPVGHPLKPFPANPGPRMLCVGHGHQSCHVLFPRISPADPGSWISQTMLIPNAQDGSGRCGQSGAEGNVHRSSSNATPPRAVPYISQ